MRQNDMILPLGISAFAIGMAVFNVFFPWMVSAVMVAIGLLIGYGALRLHFED